MLFYVVTLIEVGIGEAMHSVLLIMFEICMLIKLLRAFTLPVLRISPVRETPL